MFLAPFFGYLGDRYNRKFIMSFGIAFWSLVTLASSYTPKEVRDVFLFSLKTFDPEQTECCNNVSPLFSRSISGLCC